MYDWDVIAVCLDNFAFHHQHTRGTYYSDTGKTDLTTEWKLKGLSLMQCPVSVGIILKFRKEKKLFKIIGMGKTITSD